MNTKEDFTSDFDDVLFPTRDMSLRFFQEHYEVTLPSDVYFCGHSLDELIMAQIPLSRRPTKDEFYLHFSRNLLASFEWHLGLQPMEGALEVIPELSKKFNLRVATARLECSRPVVRHLLDSFFPDSFIGIHHVWDHSEETGFHGVPKKDYVSKLKRSVGFVDDNPKEILAMQEVTPSYLFDPFGFHLNNPHIQNRVSSWRELGDLLL